MLHLLNCPKATNILSGILCLDFPLNILQFVIKHLLHPKIFIFHGDPMHGTKTHIVHSMLWLYCPWQQFTNRSISIVNLFKKRKIVMEKGFSDKYVQLHLHLNLLSGSNFPKPQ